MIGTFDSYSDAHTETAASNAVLAWSGKLVYLIWKFVGLVSAKALFGVGGLIWPEMLSPVPKSSTHLAGIC